MENLCVSLNNTRQKLVDIGNRILESKQNYIFIDREEFYYFDKLKDIYDKGGYSFDSVEYSVFNKFSNQRYILYYTDQEKNFIISIFEKAFRDINKIKFFFNI